MIKFFQLCENGSSMITRMLRCGKFEQILVKSNKPVKVSLTVRESEKFLNGKYLYERREQPSQALKHKER